MKNINKALLIFLSFLLGGCNYQEPDGSHTSSEIIKDENSSEFTSDILDSISSITDSENSESSEENSSNESIECIPDDSTNSDSSDEFVSFEEEIKIYINPSVQYSNQYADGLGNEGAYMNSISKMLVKMLDDNTNLIVYSNNSMPGKTLSESVKESNNLDVDYHLALHSNAGGGKGSEGFYTNTSYDFTKSILDSMQKVLPYKSRGAKYGQNALYELKRTNASASLIEILFHDDKEQALFIINNQQEIAKAIFEGIVSYLSLI